MRAVPFVLGVATVLGLGADAVAGDEAAAEVAFQAAKDLAKAGNWAEACPKFLASYQLDRQGGTLLNLADCYEQEGKLASAWGRFQEGLEWAREQQDERIGWIEDRLAKLEPRVPHLVLAVVGEVPTLTVMRDAVVVPPGTFGLKLPIDPGVVAVRVLRGDQTLVERTIEMTEAQLVEVPLDLQAIERAHPPAPPPAPPPVPPPVPPPRPLEPRPYDPTQRTVGLVVGAVGIAATLTAGGLELGAIVKKGQADEADVCVDGFCTASGLATARSAAKLAEVGQWLGIAGLATTAIGVTVLLTAPPRPDDAAASPPAARWWLAPRLGPHGAGLGCGWAL